MERDRLQNFLNNYKIALYERHLYELSHGIIRASKPKFTKTIKAASGNSYEYLESGARAIIARLKLTDLYDFLTEYNDTSFDERLGSVPR